MATPMLGLRLDHPVPPADAAGAIAELLDRPCFASLTRVAAQRRDREPQHRPKQRAAIAEALLEPGAAAAILDSGGGPGAPGAGVVALDDGSDPGAATARICVRPQQRPLLASTVVVPAAPGLVDACVELAAALGAVAGFIAVEPDHDRARGAALGQAPGREDERGYYRRAQERRAHAWYDRDLETRISGPEWGVLFGPRHLEIAAPDPTCFAVIRDAGAAKLALLTEDPEDALAQSFERRLHAARRALAPLLMDVSRVPVL